jgi:hypothetical protein
VLSMTFDGVSKTIWLSDEKRDSIIKNAQTVVAAEHASGRSTIL